MYLLNMNKFRPICHTNYILLVFNNSAKISICDGRGEPSAL